MYDPKEYLKEWKKNNPEKVRQYREKHKDATREQQKRWREVNKDYIREYQRKWYKNNYDYIKEYNNRPETKERLKVLCSKYSLKRKYGITEDQYKQMLISQNGRCAICNGEFSDKNNVHIDHNHTTGKVRQLLCRKCNWGIGMFNENTDTMLKAVTYINKWNQNANN